MVSMDFRYCGVLRVKQPQSIYGNDFKLELQQASANEHQDNQGFRFACSTRYFGRIVVRDQLVWVGAARVLVPTFL